MVFLDPTVPDTSFYKKENVTQHYLRDSELYDILMNESDVEEEQQPIEGINENDSDILNTGSEHTLHDIESEIDSSDKDTSEEEDTDTSNQSLITKSLQQITIYFYFV